MIKTKNRERAGRQKEEKGEKGRENREVSARSLRTVKITARAIINVTERIARGGPPIEKR